MNNENNCGIVTKGKCNHCGKEDAKWQADHIRPLVEQKGVKEEDLEGVIILWITYRHYVKVVIERKLTQK